MRLIISICLFWLLTLPFTNAKTTDSLETETSSVDSYNLLLQFYDSLSPDSQFLELPDSTDTLVTNPDSIELVQIIPTIEDHRAEGLPLENRQQPWIFALLIFISLLIGATRFINPQIHDQLLSDVIKLKKRDRDDDLGSGVKSTILVLFFVLQCFIFALLFFGLTNYDILFTFDQSILDYLFILTAIIIGFLLKFFAYKFTGDVLAISSFSRDITSFLAPLGYMLSLLLLPIFALKYYNNYIWVQDYSIWLIYLLLGLYFLFRSLKLILTSYRNFSFNKIYLFIYLCAVEILPAVIILQAFVNFN
jgi:hypothetical protein